MNPLVDIHTLVQTRVRLARTFLAVACATAVAAVGGLALAESATATAGNCSAGYVTATKAWGTCRTASGGWGGFSLTVQCYYWGANTSYGQAPGTTWATCPGWSHITRIIVGPSAY